MQDYHFLLQRGSLKSMRITTNWPTSWVRDRMQLYSFYFLFCVILMTAMKLLLLQVTYFSRAYSVCKWYAVPFGVTWYFPFYPGTFWPDCGFMHHFYSKQLWSALLFPYQHYIPPPECQMPLLCPNKDEWRSGQGLWTIRLIRAVKEKRESNMH